MKILVTILVGVWRGDSLLCDGVVGTGLCDVLIGGEEMGTIGFDGGLGSGHGGTLIIGSRDTTGMYFLRNLRFLKVARPEPSILIMYWSNLFDLHYDTCLVPLIRVLTCLVLDSHTIADL